jgi:hypothetical protein
MPAGVIKTYSGQVLLREEYDYDLLVKELEELMTWTYHWHQQSLVLP